MKHAVAFLLAALAVAWLEADGRRNAAHAGGGWMFATVDRPPDANRPPPNSEALSDGGQPRAHRPPSEPPGRIFGYPKRQDPLFDDGTRLPYEHQHLERPSWNRPRYGTGLPQYVKPSRAQEPIRKPVYHVPPAIAPLNDKPKYTIRNEGPPSVFKPSYEFPTYLNRPNFVLKPIEKPAFDRPAYDRSGIFYSRPTYNPPIYAPDEFKPPRYAPPPFIAPPK